MALGETAARRVANEGAVIKRGRREAEGAVEEELTEGGLEEVFAADYFGDGHGCVVDDDSELIGGDVVFAPDDEIAEVAAGDGAQVPCPSVRKMDLLAVVDAEAPVYARGVLDGARLGNTMAACTGVHGLIAFGGFIGMGRGEGGENVAA